MGLWVCQHTSIEQSVLADTKAASTKGYSERRSTRSVRNVAWIRIGSGTFGKMDAKVESAYLDCNPFARFDGADQNLDHRSK